MNNAIPVGDFLYGFDGSVHMAGPKDLVCLRFSTGEVQWRFKDAGLMVDPSSLPESDNPARTKRRTCHRPRRSEKVCSPCPRTSHRRTLLDPACPSQRNALFAQLAGRPRLPRFGKVKRFWGTSLAFLSGISQTNRVPKGCKKSLSLPFNQADQSFEFRF